MLNPDTLVAVCGYSGDAAQVKMLLPYVLHHKCPTLILSPEDAPISPDMLGLPGNRTEPRFVAVGKRAHTGVPSLARQILHLKELLKTPYQYFFLNDSDSVCLSPQFPKQLYSGHVVWSNEASDGMHTMPPGYRYPRYAAQPPYFLSRLCVEEIIKAGERDDLSKIRLDFIDHVMMKWVIDAGLSHNTFPEGVSCTTKDYPAGVAHMLDRIKRGGMMLHAIKTPEVLKQMAEARIAYVRGWPGRK